MDFIRKRGGTVPLPGLPVRGVEGGERLGTGAQLGLAELVERRLDGVEQLVHVAGIGLDIEQAGDEAAVVAEKEQAGGGDLVDMPLPAERDAGTLLSWLG